MTYEIRQKQPCGGLTPSERRALIYEKEPVDTLAQLWEKYPDGGCPGWYCLIKDQHALFGWNEKQNEWTELGQGILTLKHDKTAGLLMRLLNPGDYSEKDGIIPGEIFIVPLDAGDFTFYNTKYPRTRQNISIDDLEIGQVVIHAENGAWRKTILPIYDFIRDTLVGFQHNRGVILNHPDTVTFTPPAKQNDYVYYKAKEDRYPVMWVFDGKAWQKTMALMPTAEVTDLAEYAKHGYQPGERPKTVAEIDKQLQGVNGNVDGGNAASSYGGAPFIDGGNAQTNL